MNRKLEQVKESLYDALDNTSNEDIRNDFRTMIELIESIVDNTYREFIEECKED